MARKSRQHFSDKLASLLRRAYKAKDEATLEEIVEDALEEEAFTGPSTKEDEEIHVHIDGRDEGEVGRVGFTDEDLQQHIDSNAAEHQEMFSRLDALEKRLAEMSGSSSSADDEYGTESNSAMEEAMLDEIPEELREEAGKAKDSRYLGDSFRETVSMAEVLSPGIKFGTFDGAASPAQTFKRICGLRRKALDGALADGETRTIIEDLMAGKTLDTKRMTCDAVRVLFRGAYSAKRRANNTPVRDSGIQFGQQTQAKKGVTSLAELNKLNKDHYKA